MMFWNFKNFQKKIKKTSKILNMNCYNKEYRNFNDKKVVIKKWKIDNQL